MTGLRSPLRRFLIGLPLIALALAPLAARAADANGPIEASVVDEKGQPVADAVIFVYDLPGETFAPPEKPLIMDQEGKEFVPHVLPVVVGSSVRFPNKDDIHHHIYSFSPAKKFELPLYKGNPPQSVVFDKKGVVKIGCNIHDWMSAIILVLQNPYFAVTDADGRAVLSDLPAGRDLELAVFHERLSESVDATKRKIRASSRDKQTWTLSLKPQQKKRRRVL